MMFFLLACSADLNLPFGKGGDDPWRDTSDDGYPQEEASESGSDSATTETCCINITVMDILCNTSSPASAGFTVPAGMPVMYQFMEVYVDPSGWISVNDITNLSPLTPGVGFSLTCPSDANFSHYRLSWWAE